MMLTPLQDSSMTSQHATAAMDSWILRSKTSDICRCFAWCFSMISAMLAFRACRYSGLLGSSIGNDVYHRFDTDTNHIADIRDISNFICIPNELIFLQHDVHDSKRSLNSSSFFPRQQIPALNDLLLLTGNDYAWHVRPFNEVRTKGFTDWISDVQRCWQSILFVSIMWLES